MLVAWVGHVDDLGLSCWLLGWVMLMALMCHAGGLDVSCLLLG